MGFAHAADPRRLFYLNRTAAVLTQESKKRQKPVEVPLLALEGFYCACIGGIAVYQQHQNHLQIGLDGEPAPWRQRRKFRTDTQHQFQNLVENSCLRGDDMRKFRVLQEKGREIFSAVAASLAANEVGLEEQRGNRQRARRFALHTVVERAPYDGQIPFVEGKKPVLNMTVGRARA